MNNNLLRILVVAISTVLIPNIASAFYAPHMGRFTSRDPYGDIVRMGTETPPNAGTGASFIDRDQFDPSETYHDGMNLYEYVNSNPTFFTDPSGLSKWFPGRVCNRCKDKCALIATTDPKPGVGTGQTFIVLPPGKCGLGNVTDDDDFVYQDGKWHKVGVGDSEVQCDEDGNQELWDPFDPWVPECPPRRIPPNEKKPGYFPNNQPQLDGACKALCKCNGGGPDCVSKCRNSVKP
jgi:hypothetical protein